MPHLVDDGGYWNPKHALPAYQALVWYGREHTVELLRDFQPTDWQEAALILCVAAFHDLPVTFVSNSLRQVWLSKIEGFESAQDPYSVEKEDMKIAAAALHLDSGAKEFLSGKKIPARLEQMLEAGSGLRELPERATWMATWFPMLDAFHPHRVSVTIFLGLAY